MAGWPIIDRVDDRRLAEALRDGVPDALAQIYDVYAERLFDYCHVLLRDQTEAAGSVHDAMIVAQERISSLPDPERFRGWLYTIARNECTERRNDPERPAARQKAPEAGDAHLDAAERANREEARQLVHSGLLVLSGRQREAIDLSIRHHLDATDLASVFGIPRRQSLELLRGAREDLDNALAAVMITRSPLDECPSALALTGEWPLTAEACGKLVRHVDACPTCGQHRPRKVSKERLLQVLPVAALPPALRPRVLATATDPEREPERRAIAMRAMPIGDERTDARAERRSRPGPRVWGAIGAAACGVLVIGSGAILLSTTSNSEPKPNGHNVAEPPPSSGSSADPGDSGLPESPTPSKSDKKSTTPTAKPTAPKPKAKPKPKSHRPGGDIKRPAPQHPGTLAVSGCHIPSGQDTCTITVTAQGGPASYRVTGASEDLRASGSGNLAAGQSTGVSVRHTGFCVVGSGNGQVTFSSGANAPVNWDC